jgi:hypothetical protein
MRFALAGVCCGDSCLFEGGFLFCFERGMRLITAINDAMLRVGSVLMDATCIGGCCGD